MTAEPKEEPAPTLDDVYAEYDSLCGMIRVLVHSDEKNRNPNDFQRAMYGLERLAEQCRENFSRALDALPDGETGEEPAGGAS